MTLQHHLILTQGRSGSNFIVNSLNKHPQIFNYGEIVRIRDKKYKILFTKLKLFSSYTQYLKFIYTNKLILLYNFFKNKNISKITTLKSIGSKEIWFRVKEEVIDFLADNEHIHLIYLKRKNHFLRYISARYALDHNIWFTQQEHLNYKKIDIDVKDMIHKIKKSIKDESRMDKFYTNYKGPKMKVVYEDFFRNPSENIKDVFEFLDVESLNLLSNHKKILPKDPSKIITNYDEVKRVLKEKGFQKFLKL